ncbi:MAG: YciI family protein [Candidatus Nitrosotalea sp.]|nr:YciI family protein [Candidatus Nitrosotalea sp.]
MSYFVYRLISPRTTFPKDMTDTEAKVMKAHSTYWSDLASKKIAIIAGPVLDPMGMWGLAVVEAKDKSEVSTYVTNDPVIKANIGFRFEIHPMAQAILRK